MPCVVPLAAGACTSAVAVPRHLLSVEQPRDCGAMVPPTGDAGVAAWLVRDASVFGNMHGVGAAVPRPAILWESQ